MPSKEQSAIIHASADRHIKVVAVAGSGKSTTIRQRVAHLLREISVPPNRMITLMFNKSAGNEFSAKLGLMGIKGPLPETRTFHSIGSRLCRSLTKKKFLRPAELVEDSNKQQARSFARYALQNVVGKTTTRALQLDNRRAQNDLLEFVDLVKSTANDPSLVFAQSGLDESFEPYIDCFHAFEDQRAKKKVRFFSDLIYDPVIELMRNSGARDFVSNKMDQILVDEYQDINDICQELVRVIAGDRAKVTVVGDDDQTIYAFRGSKPDYLISGFEESFKDPLIFTLSRTYRFGHAISLVANNVIRNNDNRFSKVCISDASTKPAIIKLFQAPKGGGTLSEAVTTVVDPILDLQTKGVPLSDCAILFRLFASAPAIELALMVRKIPYKLEGSGTVLNQRPFGTLIQMISICEKATLDNTHEITIALLPHVMSFPPLAMKREKQDQLREIFNSKPFDTNAFISEMSDGLSNAAKERLQSRLIAIDWVSKNVQLPPDELISGYLRKSNARELMKSFGGDDDDADERLKALDAFSAFLRELKAKSHTELLAFFEQYNAIGETSTSKILLTTVHRSKGLEWPVVILPRLSETQFPHDRKNQETDIQSERRLFYVAITRTTKYLILVVPSDDFLQRAISKKRCDVPLPVFGDNDRASRFIYEANIAPTITLAKDIHTKQDYSSLETLDHPEAFNEYLKAIGSNMTISEK